MTLFTFSHRRFLRLKRPRTTVSTVLYNLFYFLTWILVRGSQRIYILSERTAPLRRLKLRRLSLLCLLYTALPVCLFNCMHAARAGGGAVRSVASYTQPCCQQHCALTVDLLCLHCGATPSMWSH